MLSRRFSGYCALCALVVLMLTGVIRADLANFDDLTLASQGYWNGSDGSGGFTSGDAMFNNSFTDWGGGVTSWEGFAYSNITDTAASGFGAQYNAITGGGQSGSANYGIGFVGWAQPPTITLTASTIVDGLYVTNNNYTYYSMLNGDDWAKKFGGSSGDDEDWFALTVTGKDASESIVGAVDFYLADYRFSDNSQDYIIDTWQFVDLSSLGIVKSLEFTLNSSDVGDFGMNTPAYFVIDTVVPEPATIILMALGGVLLGRKRM